MSLFKIRRRRKLEGKGLPIYEITDKLSSQSLLLHADSLKDAKAKMFDIMSGTTKPSRITEPYGYQWVKGKLVKGGPR